MNCREYGKESGRHIVLLHGGGLSWWNYRDEAELLRGEFHVVLPVLDGHAGSGRPFTSIEDNAAEIVEFIDRELGGSVEFIGGLSLGGQVMLEILSQRGNICRCALVESACVIPSPLTAALAGPALGMSYGLIRNRAFARLQFSSLHIREDLFQDYYRDSCLIPRKDMEAFLRASSVYQLKDSLRACRARVLVAAGGREDHRMLRSAGLIHGMIPGSSLEVLPGLWHGGLSLNNPSGYLVRLRGLLGEDNCKSL